ncbi:MAG TPA: zf-HC2 domain-containing protein [Candidatus Acidoferrales bacterium]|nr:zf-HC2 domain-containing protein [Candidatus Acidoferrales bacterium]
MDWNCTLTEERLSDFLEGQLPSAELAAFSAHNKTCATCAGLVARVGGLVSEMRGLELVEEPPNLSRKILDATLGPRASQEGWRRWFAWMPTLWQPRLAMGIATVAACCIIVVQAGGVTPGKLKRANLNPADAFRAANRQVHLTYARGVKFVNDLRVVYEIQSRLEPATPSQPAPEQPHQQQPPTDHQQQKSETHPGRSEARADKFFAQSRFPSFGMRTLAPVALLVVDVDGSLTGRPQ